MRCRARNWTPTSLRNVPCESVPWDVTEHQVNVEQNTRDKTFTSIRKHLFQEGKVDVGGHVTFPGLMKHVDDLVCLERLDTGSAHVDDAGKKTHAQRASDCFFGAIVDDEGASAVAVGWRWGEQLGDLSGEFDRGPRDFDACPDGERCKARRGVSEERRRRGRCRREHAGPAR